MAGTCNLATVGGEEVATSPEVARAGLCALADEHLALLRVATFAARGVSSPEMFAEVAREIGRLLDSDHVTISRYDGYLGLTLVGQWIRRRLPSSRTRVPARDGHVEAQVARTGRPARRTYYARPGTQPGTWARARRTKHIVACPVFVHGRLWGVVADICGGTEPQPEGTEDRLGKLVDLLAAMIVGAEERDALLASRARLVNASDATRRRFERDLHDGVQQRLVVIALEMRGMGAAVGGELGERMARVEADLACAMTELWEISHGLHPASLTQGGLPVALKSLARRSPLPIELSLHVAGRLAESVEVAVYTAASEALDNTLRHADATRALIDVRMDEGAVWLSFHDDGCGGDDLSDGARLVGLRDRVEALGGDLLITGPPGQGTSLRVRVPT